MLEKLLLASVLTFSFSLFADMGWSNTQQKMVQQPSPNHAVFILTQRNKNTEITSHR
jgi:hypothetical protein